MPCKGYCGNEDFAVPLHRRKDIKKQSSKINKKSKSYENNDESNSNVLLLL